MQLHGFGLNFHIFTLHSSHFILHTSSVQLASNLLSRDLSAEGLYPFDWALQTQRAAITLIAVLALHPHLKGDVVKVQRVDCWLYNMRPFGFC